MLRVGPESAGADPGPACYGHGGPATVTDALVVLGRLPGRTLEGSGLDLDRAAAERALAALARELGVRGTVAAAEGVVAVAEAHMEAALRRVSVERGHDPRGAALVAFGGAGGLHACALAAALGAEAVVFPTHAGVLSALGALSGGTRRERSRSLLVDAREVERIDRALAALETSARAAFAPGERRRLEIERWCEMRYFGQSHELSIPAGGDRVARFHAAHEARFGFCDAAAPVEVVSVDVRAALPAAPAAFHAPRPAPGPRAPHETARVRDGGRWHGARIVPRGTLAGGARIAGPAVVTDAGATFWLPRDWSARVHASGALLARRGRRP
jgi:N-methylhydantoinase A